MQRISAAVTKRSTLRSALSLRPHLEKLRCLGLLATQHTRGLAQSSSIASSDTQDPAWITRLNGVIAEYPGPSFALYLGSGIVTFGVANLALTAMQFDLPALAVAGIFGKLTKKFRTPVDFSLAAALAHAVPATNVLKLGPLLSAPLPPPEPPTPADQHAGATTTLTDRFEERMFGIIRWVEGPVNKFGAPFMLVHWASGLATVLGTTLAVHKGVDVVALLRHVPFLSVSDATAGFVSGKASCLAGAMVANSLSLPLRIYLMSVLARPSFVAVFAWRDASAIVYRAHLRQQMRMFPRTFPRRLKLRT